MIKGKYKHPSGYIYVYDGSKRIIGEHRYIMEQYLGRKLNYNEIVHHKNGDKTDNRLENLEIQLRKDHRGTHGEGIEKVELICSWCGKTFIREKRAVKKNYKNYYCNRSCMGKHQTYLRLEKQVEVNVIGNISD